VINNLAGALFVVQGDLFFDHSIWAPADPPTINNAGTFRKSAGTGTSTFEAIFNNTGTVEVQTGTLSFTAAYTQTAGATLLNGGNLTSTQTLNIQGGILGGAGTVTANVNNAGGQVNPGSSPGILNITGNYTQGASGALNIEIGGLTVGSQFDRLQVSGSAALNGTLNISLINSFMPSGGNSFQILTFGSRSGDFATYNGLNIGAGKAFQPNFTATSLILNVIVTNSPPVASCRNVTKSAGSSCQATVTPQEVDNGSSDPDGNPITLSLSPPGPYPLGNTTVTLTVTDNQGGSATCTATVTVVDSTPPTITLVGANSVTVECHTSFTDPGATASDACAGSVPVTSSGSVNVNVPGIYTITYTASDGTNTTTVTRTVNVVDTTPPTVTLLGANPLTVECHSSFTDPGATANDACAGNVSVSASGSVNVNVPGSYTITYTASDGTNTATATRTVEPVHNRGEEWRRGCRGMKNQGGL
jgi:hypothetical protein